MGLLTDIYNTVAKFFRPQEELDGDASKSVATNRLKLVLMQDRTNLTPKILEQMRGEMIDLLSKYLEMDKDMLELNFEQEGDQVALMLSIPVIRAKDEDEIEEALKAEKENSDEDFEDDEDESDDDEDDDTDVCVEDETDEDSETVEESAEDTEEVKPKKKRRKKKVTTPEDMQTSEAEDINNDAVQETTENAVVEE
ncbi:MAG: cell division topological specificity factor MinE [bacterium]|nr:cell division topological specificity factor MinE [bacterium]